MLACDRARATFDHDAGNGPRDDTRLVVDTTLDPLGSPAPARATATASQASHGHVADVHDAIAVEQRGLAPPDPVAPHPVTAASGAATPMLQRFHPSTAKIFEPHGPRQCTGGVMKMPSMAPTGRNAPCPCSSGKKYKKCCLPTDLQREAAQRPAPPAPVSAARAPAFFLEDDGLDELSNSVLDLVHTGRFDEALAACTRLLEEFPDVVDGFERSGMVHAKMGNHTLAADFYRKALDFVTHPSRRGDYEDVDFYREQVENEERLAGLRRT
jgi:hypothetical protein